MSPKTGSAGHRPGGPRAGLIRANLAGQRHIHLDSLESSGMVLTYHPAPAKAPATDAEPA
jgi:hypothetical protein